MIVQIVTIVALLFILRFLSKTSLLNILSNTWRSLENRLHVYQSYKVPKHNENFQENLLYRKVSIYLNSIPSLEDSESTNLFTGTKSNDILLNLDVNQTITDNFLGATVTWKSMRNLFELKLRKKDKGRILRAYLQHILSLANEIEENKKEIRLFMNLGFARDRDRDDGDDDGRWRSIPFTHPATMETIVMDVEVKNKVKLDLETFLKSKQYYQRLGRVWRRSYLLYGASGTGKSSFVAAMARFLSYDVYDVDLSRVANDSDLKMLLVQTNSKSLIVIEGLDGFLKEKSTAAGGGGVSLSGVLSFMDGIISCCGEERLMVFTMNDVVDEDNQTVLRPGRIDVHIHFPLCDFSAFKIFANNYLGVKEHKLFGQVEEGFQNGSGLSPAQVGELMISNRSSPTRALKSVITALQSSGGGGGGGEAGGGVPKVPRRLSEGGSGRPSEDNLFSRESAHTVREIRKLYGLLRIGSKRKEESTDSSVGEKEGSR